MMPHARAVAALALLCGAVGVLGGCDRGSPEPVPSAVAPMSAGADLMGTVELNCTDAQGREGDSSVGSIDYVAGEPADVRAPAEQARRHYEALLAARFPGLRFEEQQTNGASVITLSDDVGIRGVFLYERMGSGWVLTTTRNC